MQAIINNKQLNENGTFRNDKMMIRANGPIVGQMIRFRHLRSKTKRRIRFSSHTRGLHGPPLYALLRRQGHSPHDAEDLVQGFLARLLAREDLASIGPEKGRFRTFLLTSLRNFVIKQALRDKALKRGGGQLAISINVEEAERMCWQDLTASSPEAAFEKRFA